MIIKAQSGQQYAYRRKSGSRERTRHSSLQTRSRPRLFVFYFSQTPVLDSSFLQSFPETSAGVATPVSPDFFLYESLRHCTMASRRNVRGYAPLPTEDRDDSNLTDDVDLRFTYTPKSLRKIPWKSIALALFLLLLGCSLLFLSYFIFTGHMEGDNSQAYGLLFLGILAFLPGFYETRVAYYSSRGAPGYTFASIPDY
uniref:Uncharacterized protein n=1 Tax=Oryza glumipatula TaxID=40148 RepID=A0A0E0BEX3_9ORYZ